MESDSKVELHPDQAEDEEDPTYVDVMLDLGFRQNDRSAEDKRDLDNKAVVVLAANGFLLGFIATVWDRLDPFAAVATLLFIVWSITYCLAVLKARKYGAWNVEGAWNELTPHRNDIVLMKATVYTKLIQIDKLLAVNIREMSELYKKALIIFNIAVVLAAFSLLLRLITESGIF